MNRGTSQGKRNTKALQEDYVLIDNRSILDMMHFTLDFSKHVNFYGLNNEVIDDWQAFFLKDSAFLIAKIAAIDIQSYNI